MAMRVVQIAGTKGKGSVSTYLANIVSAAGYKCGLFVSPHVQKEEERISIDGAYIPQKDLARLMKETTEKGYYRKFFQVAQAWFSENEVDVAVMETGMGGRLDPVTKLEAAETVLTHIGMDHMEVLGDTIEQITLEKSMTIRPSGYVITMPQDARAMRIIESTCDMMNARLVKIQPEELVIYEDGTFEYQEYTNLKIEGLGGRQYVNAVTAVIAARALHHVGIFITHDDVRRGLLATNLPGRQQYFEKEQLLIDGAHNIDSFMFLEETLREKFEGQKKVFLIGAMAQKDISYLEKIIVEENAVVYATQVRYDKMRNAEELVALFEGNENVEAHAVSDVGEAFAAASARASQEEALLVVTGSLYLAGEILDILEA